MVFTQVKVLKKCSLNKKCYNVHSKKSIKMFTQWKVLKCSLKSVNLFAQGKVLKCSLKEKC